MNTYRIRVQGILCPLLCVGICTYELDGRMENVCVGSDITEQTVTVYNIWLYNIVVWWRDWPRLRMSMVMSTWLCSALWYMASRSARSLAFPMRRVPVPSCWGARFGPWTWPWPWPASEPSAKISSRDSTSPLSLSAWDSSFLNTFLENQRGQKNIWGSDCYPKWMKRHQTKAQQINNMNAWGNKKNSQQNIWWIFNELKKWGAGLILEQTQTTSVIKRSFHA